MVNQVPGKIKYFQDEILIWYQTEGRTFPWRKNNLSQYKMIIAEVLLQRTRAETIANYFPEFIKKYPSWNSIARSRISTLEKVLKPIGLYKQRARQLKKLAIEMSNRKGKLPRTKDELERLPLFGQYITNATLQFVYNIPAPLLDVNMARVLERFFGPRKLADIRYDPHLQDLAWKVIDHLEAKKLNWGILDFASMICSKRYPHCSICLLSKRCKFIN